ncbi:MAG: low molecular weight protein-tyrosine-phosphatase [Mariniblastus sp.]
MIAIELRINLVPRSDSCSILFVCLGNICRSPAGEGLLQHSVNALQLQDKIEIDSAGTIGYHAGKPADHRMRTAARNRGVQLLSQSRKITAKDLHSFDLVIAMDRENLADIQRMAPDSTAELRLLSDFLGDDWPSDVPDPYYGGDEGFEYVLDMIEAACPAIIQSISP